MARVSRDREAGTELGVDCVDARDINDNKIVDNFTWAIAFPTTMPKPDD
jgi:hypothetical protein